MLGSLRLSYILRHRKLTISLIMLTATLAFMLAAIPQSLVYAGGAIGSGGSGSGGSGGGQSSNGWGWYNYSTSGNPEPAGFHSGGPWSTVSQTCRNAGADRVIAFIALTKSGTDANNGFVYDYHSSWDGFQDYRGGAGGNWLPTQTAKGLYDSLNVDKTGFIWGSNVAWFCYSSTPPPTPLPTSNDCRPIDVAVVPKQYGGNIVNAGAHSGNMTVPTQVIPVNVSIDGTKIGKSPYSSQETIDKSPTDYITTAYTTGDAYTVVFKETKNHIISYSDIYIDDIKNPNHAVSSSPTETVDTTPIKNSNGNIIGYNTTVDNKGVPKKDKNGKITYTIISGYNKTVYSFTQTNYSDGSNSSNTTGGASWQTPIGSCYDYILTSNLNSFDAKLEAGSTVSINPIVSSASYTQLYDPSFWNIYHTHTKSKPSKWQITKIIVAPNTATPPYTAGGNSSVSPCSYFDPGNVSTCSVQATDGSTVFDTNGNPSMNISSSYTVPDSLAGTKVCFAFSVYPNQSDPSNTTSSWGRSDQWSHSAFDPSLDCVIVVKKPKVQFWGGDLLVGGLISTSTSVKNVSGTNTTFGSWDEYGIFSSGTNIGMASGSAFAGSGLKNVNSACDYSALSFASAGSSSCTPSTTIGNYTLPSNLPDVASGFLSSSVAIGDTVVPNDLLSGSGLFVGIRTGDLTINASQLDPGKSVILKVSGTVTITGDQTYNPDNNGAKYTSILQLPQLVIIADRIIIKDAVSNVDAWLVAVGSNGILDTCSINTSDTNSYVLSGDDRLTTNKCNLQLTVNGPVIAQHLWLRRTAGSGVGGASGDPGEIFNLRADAYLWAAARATSSGRIQTVYTTELPPRF